MSDVIDPMPFVTIMSMVIAMFVLCMLVDGIILCSIVVILPIEYLPVCVR